jgi:hypothetical protein
MLRLSPVAILGVAAKATDTAIIKAKATIYTDTSCLFIEYPFLRKQRLAK